MTFNVHERQGPRQRGGPEGAQVLNALAFFLGDSRPGAFVVADMCANLLVELAFGAVLSPEMEVGCNLMRRDCSRCLDSGGWQCFCGALVLRWV